MRQSLVRCSAPVSFVHSPSLADFITTIVGFKVFGTHTRNTVPTGIAVSLTQDVTIRRWAERENNIVHWTEFAHGGHFAALEVPEVLVRHVVKFFRSQRVAQ